MPINHIVLVKLKAEFVKDLPSIIAEVDGFLSKVPHGTRAVVGPPMSSARAGGYDFGLYREFKDGADFLGYQKHPDHMAVVTGILATRAESFVSFQIDNPKL